jgi:hypothetical protein
MAGSIVIAAIVTCNVYIWNNAGIGNKLFQRLRICQTTTMHKTIKLTDQPLLALRLAGMIRELKMAL